jgi:trk system potassium uptake protein TrkH
MVIRIVGLIILLFGLVPLFSVLVSFIYADGCWQIFAGFSLLFVISGCLISRPWQPIQGRLTTRDGFLIVSLVWLTVSIIGSFPLVLILGIDWSDALFESASAFTTTGATVLSGLDGMPPSLLVYRQLLQWLGGIGFIVSAIAIMPLIGIGGMKMMNAELPGPVKNEKLAPRVTKTAQIVFNLYIVMTVSCALFYWWAGMPVFDAIAHSLTTLSTGGFSIHDASIGFYNSQAIEGVAVIFMLLAAINFSVHYRMLQSGNPLEYWRNTEVRFFLLSVICIIIIVAVILALSQTGRSFWPALRASIFTVASVITSTGYGIEDFSLWPAGLPVLLIFLSFMSGCSGSTSGGMKVIRIVILLKQGTIEMLRLVHPRLVMPLKIQDRVLDNRIISSVWGFFAVYIATFVFFLLVMMALGMDQVTAFGAVATCINNLGPGLGEVATGFSSTSDAQQFILSVTMIMGRLELFTLLVLLTPDYWKH